MEQNLPPFKDNGHPLQVPPETMRALGYAVVDHLVEHYKGLEEKLVTGLASRKQLAAQLDEPLPKEETAFSEMMATLQQAVFPNTMLLNHPRFFAFVPGPTNFISVLADALASGYNTFAGTWFEGAGAAQLELTVLNWMRELVGMPAGTGGILTSGGSLANVTALALARSVKLADKQHLGVAYLSDQTHSSVERGLRFLGFQPGQIRTLESDEHFQLPMATLQEAVVADRKAGRIPFCVIGNAGTTNTGAVDPLPQLAAYCKQEAIWFHVDGAYGAPGVLHPVGKERLTGMELADSLTLDPHKWLFQPYEIGCLLVQNPALLHETFHVLPEYLKDIGTREDEVHFCDYGPQLTRSFRALKLWMSLKYFGMPRIAQAVCNGMEMALYAEQAIEALPGWRVMSPAKLGIVTFRYQPEGMPDGTADAATTQLAASMVADGYAMLASTQIKGHNVLRFCTVNPATTHADITSTLHKLQGFATQLQL